MSRSFVREMSWGRTNAFLSSGFTYHMVSFMHFILEKYSFPSGIPIALALINRKDQTKQTRTVNWIHRLCKIISLFWMMYIFIAFSLPRSRYSWVSKSLHARRFWSRRAVYITMYSIRSGYLHYHRCTTSLRYSSKRKWWFQRIVTWRWRRVQSKGPIQESK